MAAPVLADLKSFLGLQDSDTTEDEALQQALDAALSAQAQVCAYPLDLFGEADFTDDLSLAIIYRATRYMARRNSPEGIIGLTGIGGDFVATRVPFTDVDVLHLEGPYRKLPVA